MLCVYNKSIVTRLPDYIKFHGHNYARNGGVDLPIGYKRNHKLAVAAFSWAIAFNINNSYNSMAYFVTDRGDEYFEEKLYEQALDDYHRAIRINPRGIFAYIGWYAAYYKESEMFCVNGQFCNDGKFFFNEYNKINPQLNFTPVYYPVYADIWRAIEAGGDKKAIIFAERGLECAGNGDKQGTLENFLQALKTDAFLFKVFSEAGEDIYIEAIESLGKALKNDLGLP